MKRTDLAFGKPNFIICAIAIALIFAGFLLMTGDASTLEEGFNPDIFSNRRIVIAPMTSFFGFLLMIVAILYPNKKDTSDSTSDEA